MIEGLRDRTEEDEAARLAVASLKDLVHALERAARIAGGEVALMPVGYTHRFARAERVNTRAAGLLTEALEGMV